jgi:membrane-associated phospholipid phosphatase
MLTENRRNFILLINLYLVSMVLYILNHPKGSEVLYCHNNQAEWLTSLFKWVTQLGEWISLLALGIYLLIKNRKALLAGMIAFIPMDMLMLWIKRVLNYPRPLRFFQHGEITAIIDYPSLYHQSMPSGHSFTAFFIASFVCFFFNLSFRYSLLIFALAVLIGFSRVYLLCHFIEDVLLGSIMGITAGILPSYIYPKLKFNHAG